MNEKTNRQESVREQFLLTEMQHVSDAFLRNEEFGEGRLNLLLAIAIGGAAAFTALLTEDDLSTYAIIAAFAGVVLILIFGWQTYRRILARNVETDRLLRSLRLLRSHFVAETDTETLRMLAHSPYTATKPLRSTRKMNPFQSGGLAELTMLLNSFIAAIAATFIVMTLAIRGESDHSVLFAAIAWLVVGYGAYALQVALARRYYRNEERSAQ